MVRARTDRTPGGWSAGKTDNVNTYSVARIIESSPARVVIHWRTGKPLGKISLTAQGGSLTVESFTAHEMNSAWKKK